MTGEASFLGWIYPITLKLTNAENINIIQHGNRTCKRWRETQKLRKTVLFMELL